MTLHWKAALAVAGLVSLSGCSTTIGVDPWQRDILARESMQMNPEPMLAAYDEHIYFSKEAATGGASFDGGGCGCN